MRLPGRSAVPLRTGAVASRLGSATLAHWVRHQRAERVAGGNHGAERLVDELPEQAAGSGGAPHDGGAGQVGEGSRVHEVQGGVDGGGVSSDSRPGYRHLVGVLSLALRAPSGAGRVQALVPRLFRRPARRGSRTHRSARPVASSAPSRSPVRALISLRSASTSFRSADSGLNGSLAGIAVPNSGSAIPRSMIVWLARVPRGPKRKPARRMAAVRDGVAKVVVRALRKILGGLPTGILIGGRDRPGVVGHRPPRKRGWRDRGTVFAGREGMGWMSTGSTWWTTRCFRCIDDFAEFGL